MPRLRGRARRHLHRRHRQVQRLDAHHRPHRPRPRDHGRDCRTTAGSTCVPATTTPMRIELMHKLSKRSRKRWPEFAVAEPRSSAPDAHAAPGAGNPASGRSRGRAPGRWSLHPRKTARMGIVGSHQLQSMDEMRRSSARRPAGYRRISTRQIGGLGAARRAAPCRLVDLSRLSVERRSTNRQIARSVATAGDVGDLVASGRCTSTSAAALEPGSARDAVGDDRSSWPDRRRLLRARSGRALVAHGAPAEVVHRRTSSEPANVPSGAGGGSNLDELPRCCRRSTTAASTIRARLDTSSAVRHRHGRHTTETVEWARLHDDARAMAAELQARGRRARVTRRAPRPDHARPRHRDPGHVAHRRGRSCASRCRCAWLDRGVRRADRAPRIANADAPLVIVDPELEPFLGSPSPGDPPIVRLDELAVATRPALGAARRRPRRARDPAVHERVHRASRRA